MHLRRRFIHLGVCAALLLGSASGAGWKWEKVPFLPH